MLSNYIPASLHDCWFFPRIINDRFGVMRPCGWSLSEHQEIGPDI